MIDLVCKISKPLKMLEINKHNIYLLSNIGIKEYDYDDDLGKQIDNLKVIEYKFNVNEIFIFRTFLNNKVLLYKIMENELYILNSTKTIINIVSYIDNYIIVFYEKDDIEIIYIKDFSYVALKRNTNIIEDYISLLFKVIEDNLLEHKKTIKENIKPIIFPKSKITLTQEKKINIPIDKNSTNIICERIWQIFSLQKTGCYCYSIVENEQRFFKYLINVNNKNILFNDIYELILFLNKEFYEPLKACSYLV